MRDTARNYLEPHYGNEVFGNIYLLAGQQWEVNIASTPMLWWELYICLGTAKWSPFHQCSVIFCCVPFVSKVNENWKQQLNSYSKSIFRSLSWFQWVFVKLHNPVLAYFYIQAIVQAHWVGNQLNYSTKWRIEGWPMACATLHRSGIFQFFVRWL